MANSQKTVLSRAALYLPASSLFGPPSRRSIVQLSAEHSRSSSNKLTCSSTAAWLGPILLPNSAKSSTAPACPVPCPRTRPRQPPAPVPTAAAQPPLRRSRNLSALPTPCSPCVTLPASLPASHFHHMRHSANVGHAAVTFSSPRVQTESDPAVPSQVN